MSNLNVINVLILCVVFESQRVFAPNNAASGSVPTLKPQNRGKLKIGGNNTSC